MYVYMYDHICVYIHIYVYVYMHVYMYIHVSKISATYMDTMWSLPLVNRQPPVAIQLLSPCSLTSNSYQLPVMSQLALGPQECLTIGFPFYTHPSF